MERTFYIIILSFLTLISNGQTTIRTEEIKIPYTNGYEVFSVCVSNPKMTYDDNKEYFWYTEFSKIKSTKGGEGGKLLHGNYKFYDEKGNLRQDKNYYLGLPDGSEKNWDSSGNIASQTKYIKGDMVYWKFRNEENYWIEFNGKMLTVGSTRNVYTKYNTLISEEKMLPNYLQYVKIFDEYTGKLKQEYTAFDWNSDKMIGKYTTYYESGKIEISGQFYDGIDGKYPNLKIGTWTLYNPDGTLNSTQIYKLYHENWENGSIKVIGSNIYTSNNEWVKMGNWTWYSEEGKLQDSKNYNWGVEVLK